MKAMRPQYPVERLCRAFDVSRSGFYAWLRAPSSPRAQEEAALKVAIQAVHRQSRETYGTRRVQPELREQGFIACLGICLGLTVGYSVKSGELAIIGNYGSGIGGGGA